MEIPKRSRDFLLSAIISDTLMFRSPTCTPFDKALQSGSQRLRDVDIEDHAKKMFRAGSDFKNKTTEEIFYQDFKIFHTEDCDFGVAQISAMSGEELEQIGEQLRPFLPQVLGEKRLNMVYVMLTDILEEFFQDYICGGGCRKNSWRMRSRSRRMRMASCWTALSHVRNR